MIEVINVLMMDYIIKDFVSLNEQAYTVIMQFRSYS